MRACQRRIHDNMRCVRIATHCRPLATNFDLRHQNRTGHIHRHPTPCSCIAAYCPSCPCRLPRLSLLMLPRTCQLSQSPMTHARSAYGACTANSSVGCTTRKLLRWPCVHGAMVHEVQCAPQNISHGWHLATCTACSCCCDAVCLGAQTCSNCRSACVKGPCTVCVRPCMCIMPNVCSRAHDTRR